MGLNGIIVTQGEAGSGQPRRQDQPEVAADHVRAVAMLDEDPASGVGTRGRIEPPDRCFDGLDQRWVEDQHRLVEGRVVDVHPSDAKVDRTARVGRHQRQRGRA